MTKKVKRRLTTVLCADVKSYSALMEADETSTLERLKDYRESMYRFVERHEGRIVNTWGDAVISEFSSVVEAVQCAIEVQQELAQRNADLSEDQQMWFRIGINLGDVMVEGDDIYGEGVNVAARLQELAQPGGICISSTTYDQVHKKLSIGFDFIGTKPMKNIADPVASYRVLLDGLPEISEPVPQASSVNHGSDSLLNSIPVLPNEDEVQNWIGRARLWYENQSPPMKKAVLFSGGLFALDIVTGSGLWFHYPAAVIIGLAWYQDRRKKDENN